MFPALPALRRLLVPALALLAAWPALASAAARPLEVVLVDRDSAQPLPTYRHRGESYVPGRPGTRYAIALSNLTGERVLAVVSVDGINVVTGQSAGWNQSGYVLEPYQRYEVTGWRKSDQEVAAFEFTTLGESYAARTGRPFDVGVVGVAAFRELLPPWMSPAATAPAAAEQRSEEAAGSRLRDSAAAAPAERLGTGHGEREASLVRHTEFERARETPDQVIALRYDSSDNLVAQGVIPGVREPAHHPRPFPQTPSAGYVPDPSSWRWPDRNHW